jgi:DNA-binding MarR family transcriptional regulator
MTYYDVQTYSARGSIGYLMRRGASLMREQLEIALAAHDFTFAQWVTLVLVRDDATLTPADLCRELHHDSGAFTRILDQLEERGYLKRQRGAADRRLVQLQLTAAGRKAIDALLPVVVNRLNGALEGFSTAEVNTLSRLLTRLIVRLETAASERGGALPPDPARR